AHETARTDERHSCRQPPAARRTMRRGHGDVRRLLRRRLHPDPDGELRSRHRAAGHFVHHDKIVWFPYAVVTIALTLLASAPDAGSIEPAEMDWEGVYLWTNESVWNLVAPPRGGNAVIVGEGLLATNAHCVVSGDNVELRRADDVFPAKV